jgi:tetratricopeptide (TPR) repeat protein
MKFASWLVCLWMAPLLMAQNTPAPQAAWQQLLTQRRWAEAESLLRQALASADPAIAADVPALRGLATVYRAMGRLTEADPLLEKLAALEETVQNLEELAGVKLALGQLDRAETLYQRSLELRAQAAEDETLSIPTHQRLAEVELALSKGPEAEAQAQAVIAIRTRKLGADHPDLAADFAALAHIYQVDNKFTEAGSTWEWAVRIQEAAYGIDDVRLAPSLENLATARRELQQFALAEAALRRALAIREVNQGQLHAEVAQTIDSLARLLFATKRYQEAEPLYQRSLEIWTRLLGADSPILALSYDNLAVTEAALKKFPEAGRLYLAALKLRDSDDFASLHNLALIRISLENYQDAEPLLKRALAVVDAPGNEDFSELPDLLSDYVDVLRQLGRNAEAAKLSARLKALKPAAAPKMAEKAKTAP